LDQATVEAEVKQKGKQKMLTQDQKEAVLRAAGIKVPAWSRASSRQQEQAQDESRTTQPAQADGRADAAKAHALAINALFDQYVAQRAARSLREAEVAKRMKRPG
jgi:hypothetical protein